MGAGENEATYQAVGSEPHDKRVNIADGLMSGNTKPRGVGQTGVFIKCSWVQGDWKEPPVQTFDKSCRTGNRGKPDLTLVSL
jgi:hypothetical protein